MDIKNKWTLKIIWSLYHKYIQPSEDSDCPFSNDNKYKAIFASLGIDTAPKKKLAPNKAIPSYKASKLLRKYTTRNRIFASNV